MTVAFSAVEGVSRWATRSRRGLSTPPPTETVWVVEPAATEPVSGRARPAAQAATTAARVSAVAISRRAALLPTVSGGRVSVR